MRAGILTGRFAPRLQARPSAVRRHRVSAVLTLVFGVFGLGLRGVSRVAQPLDLGQPGLGIAADQAR